MAELLNMANRDVAEFQQAMTHYLLYADANQHQALQPWLNTTSSAGKPAPGVLVYRNNVMHSLLTALATQYPAVQALTGPDFFAALARDYLRTCPPYTPVLTFFGAELPDFIRQHKACSSLPWLADVAALEYHCHLALHAADDPLLQTRELMQLGAEALGEVRLHLHSSAQLLCSRWPVEEIRAESLKAQPQQLALHDQPATYLLIYRLGWEVKIVSLAAPAWRLLKALQENQTLASAWEQVQETVPIADEELLPLLVYLLRLEVFSTCSFNKHNNNDGEK